ncbi:SDR family oxidoreductase [Massilia sp.]|uniref:SDR family oxidoreductase n=1 Tax=Massilia sp. TaxID=1882437 RepID=UPI00289B0BE7|nr:SDR family oxidoreductase [Massilia sp.]
MRILLTGASGFIGQHLLQALLAEGHHVVCAVRKPGSSSDPRLSYIHADFANDTDKSTWLARLNHIDAVINAVGIFKEKGRQDFARLHVEAPRALFAACAESHDVQKVIQVSALGADRDAQTPYHLSKRAADDYLAALPLRSYIVQPSLVYGRDGASARAFRTLASMPLTVRFGTAPQLVQPIHVDDVVAAIVGLLRHRLPMHPGSGNLNGTCLRVPLVGPQAMPFTDYLGKLRAAMGLGRQRVLPLPGPLARLAAGIGGLLPGSLLNRDTLRMLERDNTADVGPTAQLIGHLPRPVDHFIQDPLSERASAKLGWLLPVLRGSIALVWLLTALVSFGLYPVEDSYELLGRTGIPAELQPLMLYGAATLDLLFGLAILFLARRRWLWLAQLGLIGFYTLVIAFKLPEFLLHPYGPLTKNLPMLAAIWLLYQLEEK